MKRVIKLSTPPAFISYSAVGGLEESRGPMGERFDFCDPTDRFGQRTWEMSEGEMGRCALNLALSKENISHDVLDLIIAGDLQNQCVASSIGLGSFGVPYLGIYGACSTCTEGLLIMSSYLQGDGDMVGACVTTSHNCAAERQFRTPIEYGAQRSPSAQWTATAAGAFILSCRYDMTEKKKGRAVISEIMPGRIIDGVTSDAASMGAAMSFAAADSIISYFKDTGNDPRSFDYIVTGDLGVTGSSILRDILTERLPAAAPRHMDCGLLLYDLSRQDAHSGASGCGASASVLAAHFLPLIEEGELGSILFLSTGALMSPSSVLQGNSIYGVAPLVRIDSMAQKTKMYEKE